jgi:uncharacterized protein (TIGR03437 family)
LPGQNSSGATTDAFVMKYDRNGNLLWTHQFGAGSTSAALGVVVETGGIYVAGRTNGRLDGQPNAGNSDAFVRRYDSNGNVLWTRQLGTGVTDSTVRITTAPTGIVVGVGNGIDILVAMFDTNGNEAWRRQLGSPSDDTIFGIAAESSGIYIAGQTSGALPGQVNHGLKDGFILKLDLSASIVWINQFGSGGTEVALGVAVDADGLYVIGVESGRFLRKLSHEGTLQWERPLPDVMLEQVAVDTTGIYITGEAFGLLGQIAIGNYDVFVRRYDSLGNEGWSRLFGTTNVDAVLGLGLDASSVYVVGEVRGAAFPGQTYLGGLVGLDAYVVKLRKEIPPPVIFDGGVVNNASFTPHPTPVAPGSIAAIFGNDLTYGSSVLVTTFNATNHLVTNLAETSVLINNILSPLFYSTPSQLGIQIPWELAGQTSAMIQVKVGPQISIPRTIFLDTLAPGIFTVNQNGTGLAAALHEDSRTPITPENPARPGEVVVLYATGLGPVNPPLETGQRITGRRSTASPITATIDGIPAVVEFAGIPPLFVGLYQINIRLPEGVRPSQEIPVVLTIGGKQSNLVTIPVFP